ncbi:hypothetical protein [Gulosibacter faecalis]|uniref:Uncharacterized protein n=1 Tax=Gulosibacter faecalis TaxID=272240 RepID=A0ABW5V0R3_9MICO|nr:hypothetical protein [Gulosibacter faecalis]
MATTATDALLAQVAEGAAPATSESAASNSPAGTPSIPALQGLDALLGTGVDARTCSIDGTCD